MRTGMSSFAFTRNRQYTPQLHHGILLQKEGGVYIGQISRTLPEGFGLYISLTGKKLEGFWCDGVLTDIYFPRFENDHTKIFPPLEAASTCCWDSSRSSSLGIIKHWNTKDVLQWLKRCGFDLSVQLKFKACSITGVDLLNLTLSTLKEDIQIISYGTRIRLLHHLHALRFLKNVPPIQEISSLNRVKRHEETNERSSKKKTAKWNKETMDAFTIPYAQLQFLHCLRMYPKEGLYYAKWLGKDVAVKVYYGKKRQPASWQRLIRLLKELRHPNIVLVLGVSENPPWIQCIVMEWMQKESLFAWLHPLHHTLSLRCSVGATLTAALPSTAFRSPAVSFQGNAPVCTPMPLENRVPLRISPKLGGVDQTTPFYPSPPLPRYSQGFPSPFLANSTPVRTPPGPLLTAWPKTQAQTTANCAHEDGEEAISRKFIHSKAVISKPENGSCEEHATGIVFDSIQRRFRFTTSNVFIAKPGKFIVPFTPPLSKTSWKLFPPALMLKKSKDLFNVVFNLTPSNPPEKKRILSNKLLIKIARDVALGCMYLNQKGVGHLNLKAKTVLLDDSFNAKLTDFGVAHILDCFDIVDRQLIEETAFSKNFNSENGCYEFPHPYNWCAPEVLQKNKRLGYDESSDVYSYGILLMEMTTSSIPFETLTAAQVMGCVGYVKAKPTEYYTCDLLQDIIDKTTQCDSKKRINFEEIVNFLERIEEKMLKFDAERELTAFMGE